MSERILITGGAGFIGSHLVEQLLTAGRRVTVLDDLSTGRRENLARFESNPSFAFYAGSVEQEALVDPLVEASDAVYHLAAAVGVQLIVDKPIESIRKTVYGTEVVLEAAHRHRRPVLIASSSEVYGKGTRVPFGEDDDVLMGSTRHTRWCYAYSKGIDEFLALAYHRQHGLPVTIVRLFNTVGPRQVGMYGMVLPRFVSAALKNQPLQVYGDGRQTRCFCHVSDIVDAMVKLMATPSAAGQVFNLGSDEEVSINELAARVIAACASKSTIEYVPYEQAYGESVDDLLRRVPRLDRIRQAIGFRPRFNLEQIIETVVTDQKRHA